MENTMDFNDRVAALMSCAVYVEKEDAEEFQEKLPKGWSKRTTGEHAESGFFCVLAVKENATGGGGSSCFALMGTSSTAGKEVAKGQMKSNAELRKDPDDDLRIIREAVKFVEEQTKALEGEGGSWKHYICGHSLGGAAASCVTVALPDTIEQCVTFESPGMIKYYRKKAEQRDSQFWKDHIKEYVSFPNPINTALPHVGSLYRLHMVMQAQASPGHVIRCFFGTSLRLVVWVSLANVAFAAAGRAQGFWAAKLGSVVCKLGKLLLARKFTPKRAKQAFKDGIKFDQASKDSRAAEKGEVNDPGAKPLKPVLNVLPEKARPAFIVGFWAIAAASFASSGYLTMRTLAQINDCMAEHSVEAIAKHFSDETGEPEKATEMESWPYHEKMVKGGLPQEHFRRCMLEGLTPFHPTAYGFHNLLNRENVVLKRASTMPGFKEA
jgi:hypothetical protein